MFRSSLVLSGLVFSAALSVSATTLQPREALENPEQYFSVGEARVTEISDRELAILNPDFRAEQALDFGACDQDLLGRQSSLPILNEVDLILDQVINMGKKVWNIVAAGTPVANYKTDVAYALPRGVRCWTDLSSWQAPEARTFKVEYQNKLGMTVIQFAYRLNFTHGGQVNGQGQYITNATMLPAHIRVSWGFNFDAKAEVPSVFNAGSVSEPIGAMQMNMAWEIKNVMTHEQRTESYFITGQGELKTLN